MDYRQYLLDQDELQLMAVAKRMWPNNKNAKIYLSMKLSGTRKWTAKDDLLAKKALSEIGEKLIDITK